MATSTIVLDDKGDLTLIVGPVKQHFLVCSHTLSRTSHVFNAMLYEPFRESRPKGDAEPWVVELPDDDENMAKVIFEIIHAKFADVPDKLGLCDLYGVLAFADKYDMLKVLRPWAQTWGTQFSRPPLHESKDIPTTLAVASYLGSVSTVSILAGRLILKSSVNKDGLLVDNRGELWVQPEAPILASKLFG